MSLSLHLFAPRYSRLSDCNLRLFTDFLSGHLVSVSTKFATSYFSDKRKIFPDKPASHFLEVSVDSPTDSP